MQGLMVRGASASGSWLLLQLWPHAHAPGPESQPGHPFNPFRTVNLPPPLCCAIAAPAFTSSWLSLALPTCHSIPSAPTMEL